MRFSTLTSILLFSLSSSLIPSSSAQADGEPVDPNYVCPQATLDQITVCLGQVYTDESTRQGGPCSSAQTEDNWRCICNVQLGLTADGCWAPCPGSTPKEDQDYFDQNCKGQNFNVAPSAGDYSGSPITTTGASGSSGTGPASTSSVPSTIAPPTSSSAPASASSSSSSSSAAASSPASGNDNAAFSVFEAQGSLSFAISLVVGVGMGAILL